MNIFKSVIIFLLTSYVIIDSYSVIHLLHTPIIILTKRETKQKVLWYLLHPIYI